MIPLRRALSRVQGTGGTLARVWRGRFLLWCATSLGTLWGAACQPCEEGAALDLEGACRQFVAAGQLLDSRIAFAATALDDGRVLFVGGVNDDSGVMARAELYDPSREESVALPSLERTVDHPAAALLQDGRALLSVGALSSPARDAEEAWLFDPEQQRWTRTSPLPGARARHRLTVLSDGRVLLTGTSEGSVALYEPAADAWTALAAPTIYSGHTATSLRDGRVLITGGNARSSTAAAHLFDPVSLSFEAAAPMNVPRRGHTAVLLPDGRVLVAGGWVRPGDAYEHDPSASVEVYDPSEDRWLEVEPMHDPRVFHSATLLPDGRVLVVGGLIRWEHQASAEVYDPMGDTWTLTAELVEGRSSHFAIAVGLDVLVVAGQGPTSTLSTVERWTLAR